MLKVVFRNEGIFSSLRSGFPVMNGSVEVAIMIEASGNFVDGGIEMFLKIKKLFCINV